MRLRIWWTWLYPPQQRLTERDQKWETLLMFPGHYQTGDLAFSVAASRRWNTFNQDLLNAKTLHNFKSRLHDYATHNL